MYPKYKCERLIKSFTPKIIELLNLNRIEINFKVINSNDIKSYWPARKTGAYGFTFINNKISNIYIVWNEHHNIRELMLTIMHELLHVKLNVLRNYTAPRHRDLHHGAEEKIIQSIEKLINHFLRMTI